MSQHHTKSAHEKPVALALGTALVGGLMLSGSAFAINPLAQGYLLGAQAAAPAVDKAKEGQCGGKTFDMMNANRDGMVSRAECKGFSAEEFKKADANSDGMLSRAEAGAGMKAMHEGKCGEGKCGGEMMKTGDSK